MMVLSGDLEPRLAPEIFTPWLGNALPSHEFRSSIQGTALRAVADHWSSARHESPLPRWRDIDAVKISGQLPIVWAWRWAPEIDDFVGRLAGDEVESVLRCSIRGRPMSKLFRPMLTGLLKQRFLDVMQSPVRVHWTSNVFAVASGVTHAEHIVLPLAGDVRSAGGVIGATLYHQAASPFGGAEEPDPEWRDAWQRFLIERPGRAVSL